MPKLTKKQTRKLTSRKTKTLLSGGFLGRLGKVLGRKTKKIKTVPPNHSPSSKSSVITRPIPGQPRHYTNAQAKAMKAISNAHNKATAHLRGDTGATGASATINLVNNPLYSSSNTNSGDYAGLAQRKPGAATGSLGTTPGYSELSPRGNPTYVPVSRLRGKQPFYEPTTPLSLPGQQLSSLAELTNQSRAPSSPTQGRRLAASRAEILSKKTLSFNRF